MDADDNLESYNTILGSKVVKERKEMIVEASYKVRVAKKSTKTGKMAREVELEERDKCRVADFSVIALNFCVVYDIDFPADVLLSCNNDSLRTVYCVAIAIRDTLISGILSDSCEEVELVNESSVPTPSELSAHASQGIGESENPLSSYPRTSGDTCQSKLGRGVCRYNISDITKNSADGLVIVPFCAPAPLCAQRVWPQSWFAWTEKDTKTCMRPE